MAKKPAGKRVAMAALDWVAERRKTGATTSARAAHAFVSGEVIERSRPAPRDTLAAIAAGCSAREIVELRRLGLIWS